MQYDVTTPAEYLAVLADDWRRDTLLQLRALIQDKAPDWQEGIEYKMLSYSDASGVSMHLNAQKNFVALYVGDVAKVDPDGVLLGAMDMGKGCIRFKRTNVVAATGIGGFLDRFIALRARGAELGC